MERPGFWDDRERARQIIDEANGHKDWVTGWQGLDERLADLDEFYHLAREEEDEETLRDLQKEHRSLGGALEELEFRHMMREKEDRLNAILTIHPGAGGTESADWAQMLMRMYSRWAERRGFQADVLDLLPGETAGIKSVAIEMKGEYAYGYLKSEMGVHRLVRLSPFDSGGRRHTSFASVSVYPEAKGEIEVEIQPEDIRVDTFRSSGAGGQHVNKTDSAVRITHYPTGIVVQCQNERSQHKNRNSAMKILKARLYQHHKEEEEKARAKIEKNKKKIEFGSQVRNYVFHPYQLVKDLRTEFETSGVQDVMDGGLDGFMQAFLEQKGEA
jgi:peptide chain release factor 2